ncbi:MAG: hypothetical protein JST40_10700 [Armatimonadetes bacterium]|nr:hypothetical protein [Armatimonadota bacterium]
MSQPTYVYIATDAFGHYHVGLSRNLIVTMRQFKERSVIPTNSPFGVEKLLWFTEFGERVEAERFACTLSHLSRKTIAKVIENVNPARVDLSREWYRYAVVDDSLRVMEDPTKLDTISMAAIFPSGPEYFSDSMSKSTQPHLDEPSMN